MFWKRLCAIGLSLIMCINTTGMSALAETRLAADPSAVGGFTAAEDEDDADGDESSSDVDEDDSDGDDSSSDVDEDDSDGDESPSDVDVDDTDDDDSSLDVDDLCPDDEHDLAHGLVTITVEPTLEFSGEAVIKCPNCSYSEELDSDSPYWTEAYFSQLQRLYVNDGVLTLNKAGSMTLSNYQDEEYGQYFSFTAAEEGSYQIKCVTTDGEDPDTLEFVYDDLDLTPFASDAVAYLKAGEKVLVHAAGNGSYKLTVSKMTGSIALFDDEGNPADGYKLAGDFDATYTYDGQEQTIEDLDIVAYDVDEDVLYSVSYENNVNAGTASVTLTGIGAYTGSRTIDFTIEKAKRSFSGSCSVFKVGEYYIVNAGDFTFIEDSDKAAISVESSDEDVVSIEEAEDPDSFTIKAVGEGTATVTMKASETANYEAFEKSYEVKVSAPDHEHSYKGVHVDATCKLPGHTVYTCDCGDSYTEDDADDSFGEHNYVYDRTVDPTCEEAGYTLVKCSVCGDTIIEEDTEVEALDHYFVYSDTVAATESSRGYHVYKCERCGKTKKEEFGCYKGYHTYTSRVVKPTCTREGYTLHSCTLCGYSYTDDNTDALGHDMEESITEATATTPQYTVKTCKVCGYKESVVSGCLKGEDGQMKHKASDEDGAVTFTPATCEEPAYNTYTCIYCQKEITEIATDEEGKEISALGHDMLETEYPTCEDEGLYVCQREDCDYEEEIPALGHEITKTIIDATYEEPGYIHESCSRCDYEEDLEASIQVRKAGSASVSFSSGKVTKKVTLASGSDAAEYGYYYKFTAPETASYMVRMADWWLDGTIVEDDVNLSVLGYAANLTKGKTYYVKVSGEGSDTFTLAKVTSFVNIKDAGYKIYVGDTDLTYDNGEPVIPEDVTVRNGSEFLDAGYYTISCSNNVNAGTATIKVTGTGEYSGTIQSTYKINKASVQLLESDNIALEVADAEAMGWADYIAAGITVTSSDPLVARILEGDDDYTIRAFKEGTTKITVSYAGDINHNAAKSTLNVVVTESGHVHSYMTTNDNDETSYDLTQGTLISSDCEEGKTYRFTCETCGFTENYLDETCGGGQHVYENFNRDENDQIISGQNGNYKVIKKASYVAEGSYMIKCDNCDYWSTETADYLEARDITDSDMELSKESFTCNGKAQKPSVKVIYTDWDTEKEYTLVNNKQYTLTYKNNVNAGTASVTISGILENGYLGSTTLYYTMKAVASAKKTTITAGQKTTVSAKYGMTKVTDYKSSSTTLATVSKKGVVTAKKAGIVTITVTGLGTGGKKVTASVKIKVLPKVTQIKTLKTSGSKKLVLTWAKNKTAGGYLIQYSTNAKFKSGVKTVLIKKNSVTKYTIKKLKSKKKYYVRIRAIDSKSKKAMAAFSKVKALKTK